MLAFMIKKFTLNASELQINQLCLAVVILLSCLKTPNSKTGGIVSLNKVQILQYKFSLNYFFKEQLYNHKAGSGQFFVKIKNEKRKNKVKNSADIPLNEDETDLIQFFKNCVIRNERDQLVLKLKDTVPLRKEVLRKTGTNFHDSFGFYFADATLVSISELFF